MRPVALTLAFVLGCAGTTATVRRTDGPPTEAVIDSSDASTLRLRGPSGNMLPLDQYQVASIDHPGNVMALFGGVCAGVGTLWLVPVALERAHGTRDDGLGAVATLFGFTYLLIGLPIFIANMLTWDESRARARAFESARPPPWMIAPAIPGRAEPIAPLRPPPTGDDDEDPDRKPPSGFHR